VEAAGPQPAADLDDHGSVVAGADLDLLARRNGDRYAGAVRDHDVHVSAPP
jgi:hypothetical protein